jgi:hypothetical protein
LKRAFEELENLVNIVNQSDAEWWPFAFMRPHPRERITWMRCFLLSCLYGLPLGLGVVIVQRALGGAIDSSVAALFTATLICALCVVFRQTTALVWNRRVARVWGSGLERKSPLSEPPTPD